MEIKEEVSAGQLITVGEITMLPIIRTAVVCQEVNPGVAGYGSKGLVGIVVVSPKGQYAIDIAGEEVPLEQYAEEVPEVKELLQSR